MNSNLSHWQNFIYGIFTSDLHLDTYIEEATGVNAGFIIPGESAHNAMVGASVGLSQTWACEAVGDEFEKEVSSALDNISDFRERQAFLLRMRYRFEKIFERLPTYQEILPRLFTYVIENRESGGLDLYERLYQFTNLIATVQYTIDEKYNIEIKVNGKVSANPNSNENSLNTDTENRSAESKSAKAPSGPVIALFFHYLMEAHIEAYVKSRKHVAVIKEKYQIPHSIDSIRNDLYDIPRLCNNKNYVTRVIDMLRKDEKHEAALLLAENDLYYITRSDSN